MLLGFFPQIRVNLYAFSYSHEGRQFIEEKDFERYKGNGKITTIILDLYFKGISLRGIKDHLKQFYDLSLNPSNILRRIQKYSKVIDNYVKTLKPELKEIWHHDEMKIQAGGKWKWLWNIMDEETKFLITTQVSTKARVRDTRNFFKSAKETAQKEPEFLITDGRNPYERCIAKMMLKILLLIVLKRIGISLFVAIF